MQKNYTGTQILVFMAAVQILSIPQLLNSPEAHHAATVMLLTYELVLCLLLASQVRTIRQKPFDIPAAVFPGVQPRFWTPTNTAALLILTGSAVAAWKSPFLSIPVTVGALAVLLCTFVLYRLNREHWRATVIKLSTESTAHIS
jgi:hypothetical protein